MNRRGFIALLVSGTSYYIYKSFNSDEDFIQSCDKLFEESRLDTQVQDMFFGIILYKGYLIPKEAKKTSRGLCSLTNVNDEIK